MSATKPRIWTVDDIRALGAVTDLPTAAAVLGIGRSTAYALATSGDFPVPVLRVGRRFRVAVVHLLAIVDPAGTSDLTTTRSEASIDTTRDPHRPPVRRHS
ncbi:helix-turn-helix transcriptional regulator [Dactylosporangium sp. CA-052675]|uniref:helix-turn-helix transcriptional regulator n=1 Tax=Dactylosporangium sp. CA-052675 TaxID=3239927 RepID=UPI003D8E30C0